MRVYTSVLIFLISIVAYSDGGKERKLEDSKQGTHKYSIPTFEINVKSKDETMDEYAFLSTAESYMKEMFEKYLPVKLDEFSLYFQENLDGIFFLDPFDGADSSDELEPSDLVALSKNSASDGVYIPFIIAGEFSIESQFLEPSLPIELTLKAFEDFGNGFMKLLQSSGFDIVGISFKISSEATEISQKEWKNEINLDLDQSLEDSADKETYHYKLPIFELSIRTKNIFLNKNSFLGITEIYMKEMFEKYAIEQQDSLEEFSLKFQNNFQTPLVFTDPDQIDSGYFNSNDKLRFEGDIYYLPYFITGNFAVRSTSQDTSLPRTLTLKAFDDFGQNFLKLLQNTDINIEGVSLKICNETANQVNVEEKEESQEYAYTIPPFEISVKTEDKEFDSDAFLSTTKIYVTKMFEQYLSKEKDALKELNLVLQDNDATRLVFIDEDDNSEDFIKLDELLKDESEPIESSTAFYLRFFFSGDFVVKSKSEDPTLPTKITLNAFDDVGNAFMDLMNYVEIKVKGVSFKVGAEEEIMETTSKDEKNIEEKLNYFESQDLERPKQTYTYSIPTFEVDVKSKEAVFNADSFLNSMNIYMKQKLKKKYNLDNFSLFFQDDFSSQLVLVDYSATLDDSVDSAADLSSSFNNELFITGSLKSSSVDPALSRVLTATKFDDNFLKLLQYSDDNIESVSFKVVPFKAEETKKFNTIDVISSVTMFLAALFAVALLYYKKQTYFGVKSNENNEKEDNKKEDNKKVHKKFSNKVNLVYSSV